MGFATSEGGAVRERLGMFDASPSRPMGSRSVLGVLPSGGSRGAGFAARKFGAPLLLLLMLLLGLRELLFHARGSGANPARDAERQGRYEAMGAGFRERGLDVAGMDTSRVALWATAENRLPAGPLKARQFPAGRADRFAALALPMLVAVRADEAAGQVVEALDRALGLGAADAAASGLRVYRTPPEAMHTTLFFHARQDGSGRPGGDSIWWEESAWWQSAATNLLGGSVELRVDDLVVAPSGVILLLLGDPGDALEPLRDAAAAKWEGKAPGRQTRLIAHVSLARVLSLPVPPPAAGEHLEGRHSAELTAEQVAGVDAACEQAVEGIKGLRFHADAVWYVQLESADLLHRAYERRVPLQ